MCVRIKFYKPIYMQITHLYHAHISLFTLFAETIKPLFKSTPLKQSALLTDVQLQAGTNFFSGN